MKVRLINIIYIDKTQINLCFEHINKTNNLNISYKTNEEKININQNNNSEFIDIFFSNPLQLNNINFEDDFIKIYIELNKLKLLNENGDSYFYFLLYLKDIINKNNYSLKLENIMNISFNIIYLNYNNNSKNNDDNININDALNDSSASVDSDIYDNEEYANKEEKLKDMAKIKNLFGRLQKVTTFINNSTPLEKISIGNKLSQKFTIKDLKMNKFKIKNETNPNLFKNLKKDKKIYNSTQNMLKDHILSQSHRNTVLERKNVMLNKDETQSYEYILPSTDYGSFLKEQNELNSNMEEKKISRETFCSGFFITSFPTKNSSIIEKSEHLPASCSHKSCSFLKSMNSEIILRYPLEDTEDLEINNLASTLCFPSGIKLCHCESGNRPNKMNDYLTLLTNRKGDRLYIMTYHFYLKIESKELDKTYEKYPLKLKLKELDDKLKNINYDKIDKDTLNVFEELKRCKEFENRTAYIPFCLALISKYPYVNQMKKCIYCIYKMIKSQINNKNLELNELLMYLIHSIPIPPINSEIQFPLPYSDKNRKNRLVILEPPKFKDINILNSNICELLKIFRIKNIIRILRLLLFEKKIIFIDDDYSRLSNVMNSFLSLIYPFQWVNIYIPIMTISMIKFLETFLPFLIGIHSSFIPHIRKILAANCNEKEQIYLIFIQEDKIRISDFFKEDSKKISKTVFLHKNLINLPVWIYISFSHILSNIQSKMKNIKKEEASKFNFEIQNAFIEIFVEMFSDYNKYIYKVGDEVIFNKNLFLSKKNVLEKKFYKEFFDSQMFLQFKEDILGEGYEYFKLKISERNSDYYKNKLEQTSLDKAIAHSINENAHEKITYVIKPQFKNLIEEEEENINNINTNDNFIFTYINIIKNEKYEKENCIIYLIPNDLKAKQSKKLEKNQSCEIIKKVKKTDEEKKKEYLKYKTEEQIKEYIFKIFKKDINKKEEDFKKILNILKNEESEREYFIKLISQNLSKVLILSKNSFDVLYNLINEILLIYLTDEGKSNNLYKDSVLLLKTTMNYGKEEKSKIITIWDLCKKTLTKKYSLLNDINFWNEWYNFEINNKNDLNELILNDIKNKVVINICKTMKELEVDKNLIDNIMNNYIDNDFD